MYKNINFYDVDTIERMDYLITAFDQSFSAHKIDKIKEILHPKGKFLNSQNKTQFLSYVNQFHNKLYAHHYCYNIQRCFSMNEKSMGNISLKFDFMPDKLLMSEIGDRIVLNDPTVPKEYLSQIKTFIFTFTIKDNLIYTIDTISSYVIPNDDTFKLN